MNKILISIFVSLFSLAVFAGPMFELTTTDELSAYIKKRNFNGVVLVAKDKNILLKKAFGFKNLESKIPLTTADRFQIGSNTKQFVAASILNLQEEGKISLEDSIVKYLPQLSLYENIKIRDLLNHTSGITNYTDHPEFWKLVDYKTILTLDDLINFTSKFPLDFEPRSNWHYSNSGYIIAGKIIEEVTGQSWDEYIKNNFLGPLSMTNTGYAEYFEKASDVSGHLLDKDKLVPFNEFNLSWALSAGALYSTVDDLFKWTSIYDDSNLLSENSKKEMQTPFMGNYGLGIKIDPIANDVKINHGGRTPGFVSSIAQLKKARLTVITLDNIDGEIGGISNLLINFFKNGKVLALKLDSIRVNPEILQEYVGTYAAGNFELKIFLENNKLFLQPNDGQPAYELSANDTDSFNLKGFAGEEFIRDQSGKVTGLRHYQNDNISEFIRK